MFAQPYKLKNIVVVAESVTEDPRWSIGRHSQKLGGYIENKVYSKALVRIVAFKDNTKAEILGMITYRKIQGSHLICIFYSIINHIICILG
ncbi:hypothetical protein CEXT_778661 [Caerostris extrusa]|uniref:Uncharacterized protein n=1 Tax=Caerostris extrusa TaxID=172846 RepID=A0AAV4XLS3_CAEEX|nr:hypothetical protein CEXT_778661 [Caerostris extrusa]